LTTSYGINGPSVVGQGAGNGGTDPLRCSGDYPDVRDWLELLWHRSSVNGGGLVRCDFGRRPVGLLC
jgi:hypothetical protein